MRFCYVVPRLLCVPALVLLLALAANAQCPPNIDFENGTFENWTCYVGTAVDKGGENEISLSNSGGPIPNRHTIYSRNSYPGNDPYGHFPIMCPNGSGYSVRLGNNTAGTEAEGISYEFTIPPNQNTYSLVYHYAVVFQDPDHETWQQPRLVLEIFNVTDNKLIECSSFTFFPYGSLLPGFYQSPDPGGDTPVWCKDWSAVTINLNGNAGKRIRLFFKTADCTFRRHFGYAYVDINSECSSEFVGAAFCKDDTAVNLIAPYGYQNYKWFNSSFTQELGNLQTISFSPVPRSGDVFAVEVTPYHGYGCLDTFYAKVIDTLTIVARAGPDMLSCNEEPVPLGPIPKQGQVYTWTPAAGLSNATISNPFASPAVTTSYVLTIRHDGGGCMSQDTVVVKASIIDNRIDLLGKPMFCLTSGDSARLQVHPSASIQWYRGNQPIVGERQPGYRVLQTGSYYAALVNEDGCKLNTEPKTVTIDIPRPGITYPIQYAMENTPYQLKARQFGDEALWSPGTSLNTPASYTPVFTGLREQLYIITISTRGGCVTVDTQAVKTIKKVEIFVPNAFTPNNDSKNDVLRPLLRGVKQMSYFRIYNRWGNMLYESRDDQTGWDGTFNGVRQPTQAVVWIVEGLGLDGKIYRQRGTTVLIR